MSTYKGIADANEAIVADGWYAAPSGTVVQIGGAVAAACVGTVSYSPDDPAIPDLLAARVARVLATAAHHGCRSLVLGAWGCGVFRNDPAQVAAAFRRHLTAGGGFEGAFERIVFAVLDKTPGQPKLAAFHTAFSALSQ